MFVSSPNSLIGIFLYAASCHFAPSFGNIISEATIPLSVTEIMMQFGARTKAVKGDTIAEAFYVGG